MDRLYTKRKFKEGCITKKLEMLNKCPFSFSQNVKLVWEKKDTNDKS
jgi:hypothetical protein